MGQFSEATEHTPGQFNWIHPKTIAREKDYLSVKCDNHVGEMTKF